MGGKKNQYRLSMPLVIIPNFVSLESFVSDQDTEANKPWVFLLFNFPTVTPRGGPLKSFSRSSGLHFAR